MIICIIFLCSMSRAHAWDMDPDPWRRQDIALEIAWQALNLMDWHQTWQIADRPDLYEEKNPLLGKTPSKGRVNWLLPLSAVAHAAVVHFLPQKYRTPFQVVSIGWSGKAVRNNWSAGIRISF